MAENQHITGALNYYLNKNHKTHHALMLTGEWGCGKTYFIQEFMKKWAKGEKYRPPIRIGAEPYTRYSTRPHYMSLYGIESLEDLQKQLFAEFYPIKNIRNTISFFTFNTLGTSASASVPYFDKLPIALSLKPQNVKSTFSKAFNNLKEAVIIFDDLERCAIPVEILFGFINQLVEHNGQKVILIANEMEITKNSKTAEQNNKTRPYAEIKEKLVGTTLELQTFPEKVLDHFIAEMEEGNAKACAEQNKAIILDTLAKMQINNYRSLRQALYDFSCLLNEVVKAFSPFMEDNDNAKEARRQLLILVLVMDMQYRRHDKENDADLNGNLNPTIVVGTKFEANPNVEKISQFLEPLFRQENTLGGNNSILPYQIVAQFLLTSTFDKNSVKQHLERHFLFVDIVDLTPAYVKFQTAMFWCLNEAELDRLQKSVEHELENSYIRNINDIFSFAINLILWQEKFGNTLPFIGLDIDSYFSAYIATLAEKGELFFSKHSLSIQMQLGTNGVSQEKLQKLTETYNKLRQTKEKEKIDPIIKRLLAGESFEKFADKFPEHEIQAGIFNMSPEKIAANILSDKQTAIYETKLYSVLQEWYKNGQNKEWFDSLKKKMETIADNKEPPFKGIAKNIIANLFDKT